MVCLFLLHLVPAPRSTKDERSLKYTTDQFVARRATLMAAPRAMAKKDSQMPLVSLGADRISATAAHTKGTLALARASRDLREPSTSRDLLVLTWSRSFPARGTGDEIAVETIAPASKRPAGPRGPHGRHSPVTALQATSAFGSRSTRSEASDGHGEVGGQLHCASPLAAATRLDRSAAERSPEVGLGDKSSPHGAMATLTLATFVLRVLETLRKSSERAKEKENVRRAGVEPTTSSARTSPRCLRGGPRRSSLYELARSPP